MVDYSGEAAEMLAELGQGAKELTRKKVLNKFKGEDGLKKDLNKFIRKADEKGDGKLNVGELAELLRLVADSSKFEH